MTKLQYGILTFCMSLLWLAASAQQQDTVADTTFDEELSYLDELNNRTTATFKTTRIANGHTVEQTKPGVLDVRINHRFGRVSDGLYNLLGLDNAVTRIGFDYGVTDYLMTGVGRSTLNKEYDGFIKIRVLNQNRKKSPVTANYLAAAYIVTEKKDIPDLSFWNRVSFLHQLLISSKFNEHLSLQLMPTFMHFNLTDLASEKNSIGAMGIGGRYKVSKRSALTVEYYYVPESFQRAGNVNPLTIGLDIETGGHVFQLFLSNASGISERSLFVNTLSQWEKGQLHIGFNISRVFTVHSKSR